MYGTVLAGVSPIGLPSDLGGEGYFFVGSTNPNYTTPFGVAVQEYTNVSTICPPNTREHSQCATTNIHDANPIVTSLSGGTVESYFGTATVGKLPVAVIAYGTQSYSHESTTNGIDDVDWSGTGYGLVVNEGSNNVSIVDLIGTSTLATVSVGSAPVAAAVDAKNAYAYVANYADSTVTKLSLSTYAVVGTFPVGSHPTAVSLDASGNLWVGGNGFVNEYNSSTYALIHSTAVSGIVNSLALSAGQNKVITSIVQPPTTSNPHPLAQLATSQIGSAAAPTVQVSLSGSAYTTSAASALLPSPYLLGGGSEVSANYGNNLSISATPGGFVVQDVYTGAVLATGTTAAPIRAIAVDQTRGYAYLTVTDANSVITFPMPGSN
jgi:YVTN family beta-propeller protein